MSHYIMSSIQLLPSLRSTDNSAEEACPVGQLSDNNTHTLLNMCPTLLTCLNYKFKFIILDSHEPPGKHIYDDLFFLK